MAGEWRTATVIELQRDGILLVEDGNHGEYRPRPDEFVESGVAFIRAADMDGGRVLFNSAAKINERARQRITKGIGAPGDVLLSHKGTVGKVALVPANAPAFVCSPQTTFWRTRDERRLDRKYLYAFLRSPGFHGQLATRAGETDMAPYVSLTSQRGLSVTLPPLPEQRAIAHILGTLDDKIELNRRMNETLEAMARALFKSWFVDFDPVRAKAEGRDPGLPKPLADLFPARLVDSELGEIPEGWEVCPVESFCESISSGGTPNRMEPLYWIGGDIPWFKTGELLDGPLIQSEESITTSALNSSSCKLWPAGTILFALYASPTVGRLGVLTRPGTSNQAAAGLIAKRTIGVPFLRRLLLQARSRLQTIAVGAAQQNINQGVLKAHRAVMPGEGALRVYSQLVGPADERQVSLAREANTLASLRDPLLSKLISGELRITDPARFLKEVAS
jgi:type I restriction enzyme S subunit